MEEVWQWLTNLPAPSNWPSADSPLTLTLAMATSSSGYNKSIILQAERTAGSDGETLVTFSISLLGFTSPYKTLWISNPIPLSSPLTHHYFLLQLVQEVITLAPAHSSTTCCTNELLLPTPKLDVGHIAHVIESSGELAAAAFFTLNLICRLFWLCSLDTPADAGFLFFNSLGSSVLEQAIRSSGAAIRGFLTAVGPDWEERFMRSFGYMLAKWCILREVQQVGPARFGGVGNDSFCPSYVASAHGLWTLKGYAPVPAMRLVSSAATGGRFDIKESVLRYSLAHHQLEAVIQMEYQISMRDPRFLRVAVRVDNIRIHVVKLGFARSNTNETEDQVRELGLALEGEKHFPCRIRIWTGPEFGSAYATGLSLGRSTTNPERETESTRIVDFVENSKLKPLVKAKSMILVRTRGRKWRWEQDAEGNVGIFEGFLCDGTTGAEVVVVGGDEMGGEWVSWRVGKEMLGRVLRWRVGGRVWVSYYPNQVKSGYFETRCVEWSEDVDLPLVDYGV